ncbi:serine/arginine repetitive matrix protein 1-like [Muntiacus reevesi]|uniref:serine/arginine repetitive matrix protein 1-like n=1 Tax=Muntiacus reevesi TaxID=9886 RepID=UPI003307168E
MLDADKQDMPRASVEPELGRKGVGARAKASRRGGQLTRTRARSCPLLRAAGEEKSGQRKPNTPGSAEPKAATLTITKRPWAEPRRVKRQERKARAGEGSDLLRRGLTGQMASSQRTLTRGNSDRTVQASDRPQPGDQGRHQQRQSRVDHMVHNCPDKPGRLRGCRLGLPAASRARRGRRVPPPQRRRPRDAQGPPGRRSRVPPCGGAPGHRDPRGPKEQSSSLSTAASVCRPGNEAHGLAQGGSLKRGNADERHLHNRARCPRENLRLPVPPRQPQSARAHTARRALRDPLPREPRSSRAPWRPAAGPVGGAGRPRARRAAPPRGHAPPPPARRAAAHVHAAPPVHPPLSPRGPLRYGSGRRASPPAWAVLQAAERTRESPWRTSWRLATTAAHGPGAGGPGAGTRPSQAGLATRSDLWLQGRFLRASSWANGVHWGRALQKVVCAAHRPPTPPHVLHAPSPVRPPRTHTCPCPGRDGSGHQPSEVRGLGAQPPPYRGDFGKFLHLFPPRQKRHLWHPMCQVLSSSYTRSTRLPADGPSAGAAPVIRRGSSPHPAPPPRARSPPLSPPGSRKGNPDDGRLASPGSRDPETKSWQQALPAASRAVTRCSRAPARHEPPAQQASLNSQVNSSTGSRAEAVLPGGQQ